MREILFRGKRIDNEEWVEGDTYLHDPDLERVCIGGFDYYTDEDGFQREEYCFDVDPETVCQYTGHTDKNGRKIFEGDIMAAHLDDEYPEDISYAKVTWNGFSWCTRETEEDAVMDDWDCENYEVVGNIFDNPELIEKQLRI